MKSVSALVTWSGAAPEAATLEALRECESVGEMALAAIHSSTPPAGGYKTFKVPTQWSKSSIVDILRWFEATRAEYLIWTLSGAPLLSPSGIARLVGCARDADAAIAYGDYQDLMGDGSLSYHPLIDYQSGSLRDDFDFGSVVLLSAARLLGLAGEMQEASAELQFGAWYDLRLRLSERGLVLHLSEPIYQMPMKEERASGERVFDYVDPGKADYQLEMEEVATDHLRRIGALLDPPVGRPLPEENPFPVEASVVIPVKNRERTIADAVQSALSQKCSFDFNVIVVDNHSGDNTSKILEDLSARDERLVHRIPERRDLLIGGCWNEAIAFGLCGRIAVQLDSDDLYAGDDVLERIVGAFRHKPFALVIGSYTTVNFDLQPLPPGLIDHREWTESNGHNNALRIAGLGAPRAFHVPTLRSLRFPNVSYGEDYAVVLRLCRTYRVGRIYESLYWCRRWEENSDSALSLEVSNRYASYKDRLRSIEISARKRQKLEGPAE